MVPAVTGLRRGPVLRENLGLLEHGPRRLLLLVGRVAMLAEDPLDEDPQLRPDVVADRQAIVTFARTEAVSSRAMASSSGSPRIATALSFVSSAS